MQTEIITLSGYRLRPPHADEGDLLLSLIEDVLAAYGLPYDRSPDDRDLEALHVAYGHPDECFYVIESETGETLGCGGLKRISETEAEIRKMYLKSQARGKGLGRGLMSLLLDWAKKHGYTRVTLETNQELSEARTLYEKFGFKGSIQMESTCNCDLRYELSLVPKGQPQPLA